MPKKSTTPPPASGHAKFGGSNASRWLSCRASTKLENSPDAAPNISGIGAIEGTAAHKMAELSGLDKNPAKFVGLDVEIQDDRGTTLYQTAEPMVPHVKTWQQMVKAYIAAKMPGAKVYVEQWLDMSWLAASKPQAGGTGDLIAYDRETERLLVADFKYGIGHTVVAQDNVQGAFYIVAAIHWLREQKLPVRRATFMIVQPRGSDPELRVTYWFIKDAAAFFAEWSEKFRKGIEAAESADPKNPSHAKAGPPCGFCRAVSICPVYTKARSKELAEVFDAAPGTVSKVTTPPPPTELTQAQLVRAVEVAPLVIRWLKACQEVATHRLAMGKKIPGLKLVAGRSNRKWNQAKAKKIAKAIEAAGGDPWVLVGITEGGKHLDAVQMDEFTIKPDGRPQAVVESDPRPAVQDVQDAFDDAEEGGE